MPSTLAFCMRIAFAARFPRARLAACAQHGSALLPSTALRRAPRAARLVPPNCKGQKTTKHYASLTVTLSTKGGSLCIPAFGGFGGYDQVSGRQSVGETQAHQQH